MHGSKKKKSSRNKANSTMSCVCLAKKQSESYIFNDEVEAMWQPCFSNLLRMVFGWKKSGSEKY